MCHITIAAVQWSTALPGWGITGNNIKTVKTADVEICQLKCLEETEFTCVSIEYGERGTKDCQLNNITRAEAGEDWEQKYPNADYYDYILPLAGSDYSK